MAFNNIFVAFALTLFAGLSTGIGAFLAFYTKRTNKKVLSVGLGFAAGVMIYVSFVEIFFSAQQSLASSLGLKLGSWITVISFFTGILIATIIDKLVPSFENPHEPHEVEEVQDNKKANKFCKLHRVGMLMAVALAIHNFPEGIATFISALSDIKLGIVIAIAIAIHNIPEGIAISLPIYCATGNKKKAFTYAFLSGLAEPLGAVIAFLILYPFLNDTLFGIVFAAVAGIMVFISLDQLLPAAREYGESHLTIYGLISGMAVMAISLLLFL